MKRLVTLLCIFLILPITACTSEEENSETNTSLSYSLTQEELDEKLNTSDIGVLTGGVDESLVPEDYPNATIHPFSSNSDILAAVSANKVDYGLCSESQAILSSKANDYAFEYCDTALYVMGNAFALSKENTELKDKINDCISELKEDGTLQELQTKWIIDGAYTMEDVPVIEDEDAPVLEAAVSCTTEPFAFIYNGEPAGHDVELIKRIAYMLGMRIEIQQMDFSATITSVVSGKSDVALSITPTEERAQQVDFTEIYHNEKIVIVSKKDNIKQDSIIDTIKDYFTGTFITENRWKLFVDGIEVTVVISVFSYLLGTVIGALLCLMLMSKNKVISSIAKVYCKLATGIPILVWLMILYYIVFKEFDISGIIVAIIAFGLQTGASLSGIFKTGIDSVDVGQKEAAEALGFNETTIFRKIIFPQAALKIFDLYKGEFVSVVKTTSIVGYVAISDLTKVSDIVRSRTYQAFFPLIATAIIYFVVTYLFILLLNQIQKKINPKLRKQSKILKNINKL